MSDRKSKIKVLVADDSVTVQKLVHLTFVGGPFEVITATDGHDAAVKLKSMKPDLVLADSSLSGLSGLDLFDLFKREKNDRDTRFILFKSGSSKEIEVRLMQLKPHGVLKKPFDSRELKEMVDLVLGEETMSTQVPMKTLEAGEVTETTVHVNTAVTQKFEVPAPTQTKTMMLDEVITEKLVNKNSQPASAEIEIKKWIEDNLPALAEKIFREEIEKLISKSS